MICQLTTISRYRKSSFSQIIPCLALPQHSHPLPWQQHYALHCQGGWLVQDVISGALQCFWLGFLCSVFQVHLCCCGCQYFVAVLYCWCAILPSIKYLKFVWVLPFCMIINELTINAYKFWCGQGFYFYFLFFG